MRLSAPADERFNAMLNEIDVLTTPRGTRSNRTALGRTSIDVTYFTIIIDIHWNKRHAQSSLLKRNMKPNISAALQQNAPTSSTCQCPSDTDDDDDDTCAPMDDDDDVVKRLVGVVRVMLMARVAGAGIAGIVVWCSGIYIHSCAHSVAIGLTEVDI